jgi:prepilin-type processing-associated H-X9-DG protein
MTRLNSRRRCWCARNRHAFTYVELLVVLVLIVLGIAFLLPVRRHQGESSVRVKCSSNLRQIGQAMLLYSNDFGGAYPVARISAGPVRTPTWGKGAAATQPYDADGPAENDVTAALFLLLRTQDITPEVFCCPNSNAEKDFMENKAANQRSNFTDFKKNLSYSLQNPYADDSAVGKGWIWNNKLGPEYAVAADLNPGVMGSGDNVFKPTATSSAVEMKLANSNNHDKDGQNILYGDGHVSFESNPFVGVNRDHIYTASDGKLVGSPVDANDSVLLPTDD